MLIDTGSKVTILRQKTVESWPKEFKPRILPVKAHLLGITGDKAPFHGRALVNMKIGRQSFDVPVLIADIQQEGILGRDFILSQKCELHLNEQNMKINGETMHYFSVENQNRPCYVTVTEEVAIPPDSEIITTGRLLSSFHTKHVGIVESHPAFVENHNLLVATALVKPEDGLIPIRILTAFLNSYTQTLK